MNFACLARFIRVIALMGGFLFVAAIPAAAQGHTAQSCGLACEQIDEMMTRFTPPNRCECECKPGWERPRENAACEREQLRDAMIGTLQDRCVSKDVATISKGGGSYALQFKGSKCKAGLEVSVCIWKGRTPHTGVRSVAVVNGRAAIDFFLGDNIDQFTYAWTTDGKACNVRAGDRKPIPRP